MDTNIDTNLAPAATNVVGDAGGVEQAHWFVAMVRPNAETTVAERLTKSGYESYVPAQNEIRIWNNGRKANVRRLIIPAIVFVHCTERKRIEILKKSIVERFMTNRAGTPTPSGHKPPATVPDEQMERLRFMVGNSDTPVQFSRTSYKRGDFVKVIRGRLAGLEGEIQTLNDNQSELVVSLDFLGNARLTIETVNVQLLKKYINTNNPKNG